MTCAVALYVGNSNTLQLGTTSDPLANAITGATDTGATVTATVYDAAGTAVSGETWPVTLVHNSGGIYQRTLASDLAIVEGRRYKVVVHAVGSGAEVGDWTVWVEAEVRSCT